MPLRGYGLLIGKVVGSRPPRGNEPHWALFVQPGDPKHPHYRVGVNFQKTQRGDEIQSQYQIVKFSGRGAAGTLIGAIRALGIPDAFLTADSTPGLPRLDFVRGGILNARKFIDLKAGDTRLMKAFSVALKDATKPGSDTLVAVFGTGYPSDDKSGRAVPTGYTGVDNVHMNQGSLNHVDHPPHYRENGPGQDGGIIFLTKTTAIGFFIKFPIQQIDTRDDGHPAVTGIPELDDLPPAIRRAIMPPLPRPPRRYALMAVAAPRPPRAGQSAPSTPNPNGYVFADFDPNDDTGTYVADVDDNYETPFVQNQGKLKTKGPVPSPRGYPTLDLTDITGANPSGYSKTEGAEEIAFDIIGDSGAPNETKLNDYETPVTGLLSRNAQRSKPAFLYHVGDVVYYYGEKDYYYSQFYEPFRSYPAPIFAIPGNHDGIISDTEEESLQSFRAAFCAQLPGRWEGSGGILRSTMTQPGVYFTLDAPLVSIIGLYSNVGESFGFLDAQQLSFFYKELVRLKAERAKTGRAVILAIHHFPRWFPDQKKKDPNSTALDAACQKAGFWPDAVICGHAHLYQRVVRPMKSQDIPYVMTGAGGYGLSKTQELAKDYMANTVDNNVKLGNVLVESGYVRATVSVPQKGDSTLRFEYQSVKQTSSTPSDTCVLNLRTGKVM